MSPDRGGAEPSPAARPAVVPVVFAVVAEAGKYLLIQEAKAECRGAWYFPAGRAEPGEDLVTALKREAREESGLEVEPEGLLYFDHGVVPGLPDLWSYRFAFRCRAAGGRLKDFADGHSLGAAWFAPADIPALRLRAPLALELLRLDLAGEPPLPLRNFRWR